MVAEKCQAKLFGFLIFNLLIFSLLLLLTLTFIYLFIYYFFLIKNKHSKNKKRKWTKIIKFKQNKTKSKGIFFPPWLRTAMFAGRCSRRPVVINCHHGGSSVERRHKPQRWDGKVCEARADARRGARFLEEIFLGMRGVFIPSTDVCDIFIYITMIAEFL